MSSCLDTEKNNLRCFGDCSKISDYFAKVKLAKQCKLEDVWQKFFEKNRWIFGYGLNYIFLENLDHKKLEQYVQGYHVGGHGKRVDGLMKTKGAVSNLCLIEMKTHETGLLGKSAARSGCWPASSHLAEAIAQTQGTVAAAMDTIRGSLKLDDDKGYPTGEEAFNYAPKSYLVIGNLAEFKGEHGVNREKLKSFELFRRNLHSPEIITFDELYERAISIVSQIESISAADSVASSDVA
jgi:hypothetical protein